MADRRARDTTVRARLSFYREAASPVRCISSPAGLLPTFAQRETGNAGDLSRDCVADARLVLLGLSNDRELYDLRRGPVISIEDDDDARELLVIELA